MKKWVQWGLLVMASCGARAEMPATPMAVMPVWPDQMVLYAWQQFMMLPMVVPYTMWQLPQEAQQILWLPVPSQPESNSSWPPPLPPVPFLEGEHQYMVAPKASAPMPPEDKTSVVEAPGRETPAVAPQGSVVGTSASIAAQPGASIARAKQSIKPKPRQATMAKSSTDKAVAKPRRLCWKNGIVDTCPK
jgi:hypothetical protein